MLGKVVRDAKYPDGLGGAKYPGGILNILGYLVWGCQKLGGAKYPVTPGHPYTHA